MAKRLAVVFLAVLFFVFSTGCGKKGASEKEGKTFVYQLTSNPSTLDPQIASGEAAATVITALFEGLARQSEDGSAVPARRRAGRTTRIIQSLPLPCARGWCGPTGKPR